VLHTLSVHDSEYQVGPAGDAPTYTPTDKTLLRLKVQVTNQMQRIILNVGGSKFETCPGTLSADPLSLLVKMVQNSSPYQPYQLDTIYTYFIDRDPKRFMTILNYLRNINLAPISRILPYGTVTNITCL